MMMTILVKKFILDEIGGEMLIFCDWLHRDDDDDTFDIVEFPSNLLVMIMVMKN